MPTMSASRNVPVRGQPNRRPGQRVHFLNRQPLLQHQRRRVEHHRNADAVGDKVRRVVGKHHLLAQHAIGKRANAATSAASLSAVGITSSSRI